MDKFITDFKTKAHTKRLTSANMLALCLYRAIKAKSPEKTEIAKHFINRAFTASRSGEWRGLQNAAHNLYNQSARLSRNAETGKYEYTYNIIGIPLNEVFDEEQSQMWIELLSLKHTIYTGVF